MACSYIFYNSWESWREMAWSRSDIFHVWIAEKAVERWHTAVATCTTRRAAPTPRFPSGSSRRARRTPWRRGSESTRGTSRSGYGYDLVRIRPLSVRIRLLLVRIREYWSGYGYSVISQDTAIIGQVRLLLVRQEYGYYCSGYGYYWSGYGYYWSEYGYY